MDMPVKNYSTGMYARLAFAVAVSVEPEILVVDEVLSVGDESFQMRCYDRIAKFRSDGRTIVLVTHSLETIRTLCDHAAWIHDSRVRQIGEPLDVVAGYLGEVHGSTSYPEEVAATHQRFGTGEVVVTGVVLRDAEGRETSIVRSAEPMTVTVSYQAEEPIDHVVCSIAIYRADTLAYVFGQTSRQGGLSLDLNHRGLIEFAVGRLPLLAGHYLLSVALLDEVTHRPYDWHERGYSMMVFDNPGLPGQAGLVRVDGTWSVSDVEPSSAAGATKGRTSPEATVA
jgi:energy-coupling factor transporter ATP-binding protein EcfA2